MRFPGFTVVTVVAIPMTCVDAQWLNYPSRGTPITREGKPNLKAKAPRAWDGNPDLSGVWQVEPPPAGEYERLYGPMGLSEVVGENPHEYSRFFYNLLIDFKGEEPLTAEGASRTLANRQDLLRSPASHCLPYGLPNRYFAARPFKIFQAPDAIAMFFELDGVFRQIHTDGRKLPADPFPAWMGYSTGHWEGDTLVVETAGFNDKTWLDVRGHPHSEELHVQERFHRRDFGHLDLEVTIQDSKILTKPVNVKFSVALIPNSDVLESFCNEGERDQNYVRTANR